MDKHSEAVIFVGSDGLHIPSAPGVTHLSILDLRGRKIAQISNDATISLRYRGMGLPNGVYLIKARRKQASVRLRRSVVK